MQNQKSFQRPCGSEAFHVVQGGPKNKASTELSIIV